MQESERNYMQDLPLTIERQLESYIKRAGHTQRHQVLWHTWNQNKRWIMQLLEGNAFSFPTYSRHDESHAQTVLHNIELILGEDRISKLSATDSFLILHTVYIHDIGMTITAAERKEIVKDKKFLRMVDYLEEEGDGSLRRAVQALKRNDYTYTGENKDEIMRNLYEDKLEVYTSLINLIANYRRGEHGEKSKEKLSQWAEAPDKLGIGFSLAGMPQRIFLTIAECARMHTEPEFDSIMQLPQEDDGYVFDYMHPRFVSVLLQLGDLLDMDNDRFHPLAMESLDDIPEQSRAHYMKHLSIRRLHIRPEIIKIAADCKTQEALRLVRRECDMLIGILQKASFAWSSICPAGFPGALPRVEDVDLYLQGQKIPQELVTAKFMISQKKAFEILEGSNLYVNRFAFLREFLQNAIDATKLQYWKECKGTSGFYQNGLDKIKSPYDLERYVSTKNFPIEIEMEICKLDAEFKIHSIEPKDIEQLDRGEGMEDVYGAKVIIKDFGIGIDQESIRRISQVGTSMDKETETFQEMPDWLKPTAEFGVGMQSAFLVTRTFKCTTHTRSEERYEITFGSGALAQYDGYINVSPVKRFEESKDTYGTCFELFVPESKKMLHEEFPQSWDGEDIFSDTYEKRRPLRHAAELISQMTLFLDSLIGGTSIFPIHLKVKGIDGVKIPINTAEKNMIHSINIRIEGLESEDRRKGRSKGKRASMVRG
ncbi:MAG: hypothetical protein HDR23_10010 [Lachnospiraceae bacterium]|nr:hypothetical protein [Lachnospiraceae bacterium]